MADDLRADFDQLLPEAGQRPRLCCLWHRQCAHEITQIVGKRVELKANGIGGEGAAGQPRPFDRALSFFDPLLTCPALIIEGDNAFSGPRQVSDDKSDTRVQLAWMPFDLGYDMARPVPALRLIAEAGVVTPYLVRWSSDRSLQQISDLRLQDLVGREPDRVAGTLGFRKLVDLGISKGPVTREI